MAFKLSCSVDFTGSTAIAHELAMRGLVVLLWGGGGGGGGPS